MFYLIVIKFFKCKTKKYSLISVITSVKSEYERNQPEGLKVTKMDIIQMCVIGSNDVNINVLAQICYTHIWSVDMDTMCNRTLTTIYYYPIFREKLTMMHMLVSCKLENYLNNNS